MRSPLARSRRRIAPSRLGVAAAAIAAAALVAGCDATEDANVDRGRALFQQNCGTCHALAQAGTSANIGPDLDEARAKIEATRGALQAALDGQEAPDERLMALVVRLDRMAVEVERVEDTVAEALGEAMAPAK